MDGSSTPAHRRTVTTPVVVSIVFVVACAVFAVSFVGARGGLQLPVASRGPVALASGAPTDPRDTDAIETEPPAPDPSIEATPVDTPAATPAPTPVPTAEPSVAPTSPPPAATAEPAFARPTLAPGDPLLALHRCDAAHPTCFTYVVQRGDTLSGIISRYLLDFDVLAVLNPQLRNPNVIVLGQTLYLARDPFARLERCPGGAACYVYEVVAGDSVARIAARFGLTTDAVLSANPGMPRPLVAGQAVRLPAP